MSAFLEIWNLGKSYPSDTGTAVIVKGFSLSLAEGEFVSLIGHSGCGKSTVLSMVAGLIEPTTGGVILAGREIDGPATDRGMVFQSPNLLPWMSALDNVQLGVDEVMAGRPRAERRDEAMRHLELVGLADAADRMPAELSQGMRQRVGLARAFALDPKMLLLDEPFGMLDSLTRMELQDVLLELWARDRKTALMVTHDVEEAITLSDRIAMMTHGPAAHLGGIVEVGLARPRKRPEILEDPGFLSLRERVHAFLGEPSPIIDSTSAETTPLAEERTCPNELLDDPGVVRRPSGLRPCPDDPAGAGPAGAAADA
jgi:nitrate/nitrite transport system ATP-binding protein